MKKGIFALTIISLGHSVYAQDYSPKGGRYGGSKTKYRSHSSTLKRNSTDVFPLDPDFRLNGWFAAIGGTYMFPMAKGEGSYYNKQQINDSTLEVFADYNSKPKGKLGIYAELGWFHSFQNPGLFHFLDLGISYRQYKGSESFSGTRKTAITDTLGNKVFGAPVNIEETDTYSDQIISFVANLTNHYHFSRYGFIQNTIGTNVDYFLSSSRSAGPVFPGYEAKFPTDIQAQLHYRFGVGWKASRTLLVIPSVEIPALTIYSFDNFKSSLPYFSTRHYPILFSIRFMFLRPIKEDCVVPEYDGPSNFE